MRKLIGWGVGAFLALAVATIAPSANAQDLTPPEPGARTEAAPAASRPARSDLDDIIIVDGRPRAGVIPQSAVETSARAPRTMTSADFVAAYGQDALPEFREIQAENTQVCERVRTHTLRLMSLMNRSEALRAKYSDFDKRLQKLARDSRNATWLRRGMGVVAVGVAATVSGPYALIVGAGVLGNEGMGTANDRANKVWRDLMGLSVEASLLSIDASMLHYEDTLWWYEEMAPICARRAGAS